MSWGQSHGSMITGMMSGKSPKKSTYTATPAQQVAWNNPNESASETVGTPYDAGEFGEASKTESSRMGAIRANAKRNRRALQILQYPKDLGISSEHAHYMGFSTYNIRGTMGASGSDNSFTETGNHVFLPIPGNPSASYEQGWETEEYGIAGSALASGADAVMDAYRSATGPRPGGAPEASLG